MKLSEAIRMNGMMKSQGFGGYSVGSVDAPCALGGALQSIGKQVVSEKGNDLANYIAVDKEWPFSKRLIEYPCGCRGLGNQTIRDVIWHLNDSHLWSRAQIADWVELQEPVSEQTELHAVLVGD